MKKLLAIALITVSFAACNDAEKKDETPAANDSLVTDANKMADSAKMMADTASKMMADTTHKMADTAKKMMNKAADKMMDKAADKMKDASKTMDKAADKMKEKKP